MTALILGLVVFLGVHSLRLHNDDLRNYLRARLGEGGFKGLYSLVSAVGLGLVVWGYGWSRETPTVLWPAMVWTRHLAALLMWLSFMLLTAAYVPGNGIKAKLHHPMVLGVKVWALAHLLANNTLADLVLFGSFLIWAVLCFKSARRRDRAMAVVYAAGNRVQTGVTIVVGSLVYGIFATRLHAMLIGVHPL